MRSRLARHNQEHLLQFVGELDEAKKKELFADIVSVDFDELHRCFVEARRGMNASMEKKDELLRPLDDGICGSTARDKGGVAEWEKLG